jgi:hypothetical protein
VGYIFCHCEPERSEGVAIPEIASSLTLLAMTEGKAEIATSPFRGRAPRNDRVKEAPRDDRNSKICVTNELVEYGFLT